MTDKLNMEGPSVGPFESQKNYSLEELRPEITVELINALRRAIQVKHIRSWAEVVKAVEDRHVEIGELVTVDGVDSTKVTSLNLKSKKGGVINYATANRVEIGDIITPDADRPVITLKG